MVLFIAGVILLLLEMFLPTFGIVGIIGIGCIIGGVVKAALGTQHALLSLGAAAVVVLVLVAIVVKIFRRKGIWSKFVLKERLTTDQGYTSSGSKAFLAGKTGIAATPLRPAGTAEIDGERIDVVTEGEFIARGKRIIVHKVEGSRVVVREV